LEGKLALITKLQNTLVSACQALLTNVTAVQVSAESAVYAQPHDNACSFDIVADRNTLRTAAAGHQ
jgi:hypothetical protein